MIAIAEGREDAAVDPARVRTGGPRTPEGKERSRRNALKHGLRAEVLLPDDLAAAVAERMARLGEQFRPASPYEEWLVGEVARASTRIDRCAELAIADLRRRVDRAELCWEGDRRSAVEDLGAKLAKDPARIARALRETKQGADWLIERWGALGTILRRQGGWDDAQRALAFDLLGVPAPLRSAHAELTPEADPARLGAFVAREVAALEADRAAVLDELDDSEREMAAAGMPLDEDAPTARLRRYEAGCRRALRWALAELRRVQVRPEPTGGETPPKPATAAPASPPSPPLSKLSKAAADWMGDRMDAILESSRDDLPAVAPAPVSRPPAPALNRRARRAQQRVERRASRS